MFYVIDNFYHIFSSLYAYRSLSVSYAAKTDRLSLFETRLPQGMSPFILLNPYQMNKETP